MKNNSINLPNGTCGACGSNDFHVTKDAIYTASLDENGELYVANDPFTETIATIECIECGVEYAISDFHSIH